MKHFLRSLRYLLPYRARLGLAVVCVILIAALWGGGLGMILPGAKILIAPEGLHGWAYNTLTQDRLQVTIVQRVVPAGETVDGEPLSIVIDVVSTESGGRAEKAGLAPTNWIVGIETAPGQREIVRGDVLAGRLARAPHDRELTLLVREASRKTGDSKPVTIRPTEAKFTSRILGKVAQWIPEPQDYSGRFVMFLGLLGVLLGMTVLRALFTFTQEYLVGTAIWRGVMDLRCRNYNVVLHLPTTFFSEKGVSDATSRFIQDTNELARGQNTLLGKTLVEPAKAIGTLVLAFSLPGAWKLTLMALVAGPPAFLLIRGFGKKMHKASKRALESWSSMLAILGETLLGIRVVKSYTMEGAERKRFFRVNRQLLRQQNKMERLDAATGPTVESLGICGGVLAAGIAGYMVFNYQMDRDVFLTWMVTLFALFDPVRKLAKVAMRFQQADAAAQRVFELQDTPQETFVPNAPSLARHRESIEFRNVSFRYPGAASEALRNIDLTIRGGGTLAIVGPNGSGKTTLVSLVPRLIDPTEGTVFIDGQDISQVSVRSLRRQIGLVTQDTVIFHATIAENIAYGLRRPKMKNVVEAAQKAFVDEFVQLLPEKYDTMVGEHGATLSGGQRQRIAIARAMLRDPAILIFDEAMSQVDSDSERRIHQVMEEFVKGRTTVMIAHRFATVLAADRIAVLDRGQILDVGTHADLLARCQLYEHLYRTQFVDSGG